MRRSLQSLVVVFLASILTTVPAFGQDNSKIRVIIYPALDKASYGYLEEFFQESSLLWLAGGEVERQVVLPQFLTLAAGECGVANAAYVRGQNAVFICYELVDAIFRETPPGPQRSTEAAWAVAWVVFHELGHGLVEGFFPPMTARENEFRADQFATITMSRVNPESPLAVAAYFIRSKGGVASALLQHLRTAFERAYTDPDGTHSDPHDTSVDRFFNVACWTYGSNPVAFAQLGSSLPAARRSGCAREYQGYMAEWNRAFGSHRPNVRSLERPETPFRSLAGPWRFPTSPPAQPVPSPVILRSDFTGTWRFSERLGRPGRPFTCRSTGTFTLRLPERTPDMRFQGSLGCFDLFPEEESDQRDFVMGVQYTPQTLFFWLPPCLYSGRLSADHTRFRGTSRCVGPSGGPRPSVLAGTWEAVRQ